MIIATPGTSLMESVSPATSDMTYITEAAFSLNPITPSPPMLDAEPGITEFARSVVSIGCSMPTESVFPFLASARLMIKPLEIVIAALLAMT